MRPHFICKQEFFHPGPTVVISRHSAAWLIRIGTQETEDGASQFSGISLQVIEEINAKPVWMNVAFPSRDDRARVRAQQHPSAEQVLIHYIDVGRVKRFNPAKTHFHGQVRPHSLNRITREKDYL